VGKSTEPNKRTWADLSDKEREQFYLRMVDGADKVLLADEAGIKFETFSRRLREYGEGRGINRPVTPTGKFDYHWKLLCKFIGRDPDQSVPKASNRKRSLTHQKVAVICDLHGYPLVPLVERLVAEQPDIVALDGDIFDAFAFSHWEKDHDSPISDEMARVRAMLELMTSHNIQVLMNSGNHDDRAKKYFARRIESQFMPLVKYNLLEQVALGLPNVSVVKNVYNFTTATGRRFEGAFHNNWIIHIGDALLGHAETARKGEIRSVDAFAEWVNAWALPLGWEPPRLVVQAHVHRAGISYPSGGRLVRVEGGFAGDLSSGNLQYTHDYGATAYPPPCIGFSVFEQDQVDGKWQTDLTSVRFVLC
jgi:hypothetical protein